MRARIETACLGVFAVLASYWVAFRPTFVGDYEVDGSPTIHALIHGHLHAPQPAMGPLSIFLRAPFVWLVRDGEEPIAAAVYLTHGKLVTYKYGASAASALKKRPNNLLMLNVIRDHAERGFEVFDFGRTDLDNEGLRRFKRSLGAEEIPLAYTYLTEPAPLGEPSLKERVMTTTIRRSPAVVGRLAGQMLYRHVG